MLKGLRVVSLCHYLQGPAAVQYLADMGADVIKVEPLSGAHERHWSGANTYVGGVSGFLLCTNRNNRSLALDLKTESGKRIFLRLVETADVVVENFRTGVLDRLGLGYDKLKEHKPDLILASASGFGASGPMANQPGQDLLIQARSGLMSVTGPDSQPTPTGCAAVDQHGASLLAMGILGAYVKKLVSGEGTLVEANLFNAGIDLQMEGLTNYLSGGFKRERLKRDSHLATWFHQAPYGVYEAADGFIAISSRIEPKTFAEVLDSDELREMASLDRYKERDRYAVAVAAALKKFPRARIAELMNAAGLWNAPVQDYDQLAVDPQALHNKVFRTVDVNGESATLINHPLRYDGEVPPLRKLAVLLGEHTEEILQELGFTSDDIERFAHQRAIGVAPPVEKAPNPIRLPAKR
jgi:crotonobetainyl-CoA:carnitine CoA-transferase CaiB-like acyl-CoA transferase